MRLLRALRVTRDVFGVIGYVLALYITISPPSVNDAQRDKDIIIVFAIITIALLFLVHYVTDIHEKRREDANERRETEREQRMVDAFRQIVAEVAPVPVGISPQEISVSRPPGRFRLDLFNLGEADAAAEAAGDNTPAAKRFQDLPKPTTLRQQAFDLSKAAGEALTEYHGSEDIDSFVSPEISRAFTKSLLAVKNKIQKFLGRSILRKQAQFPVTVSRMRMFLEDLE